MFCRAEKLGETINLTNRFEMPFSIWCLGCNNHIGQGIRYNAKKLEVGAYYTTPIFNFKMKCLLCPNYIEIQTDPKNSKYIVMCGARQKIETWEPKDNETIDIETDEQRYERRNNHFMQVEHRNDDINRGREMKHFINRLKEEKKKIKIEALKDEELKNKNSLFIELVKKTKYDDQHCKHIEFLKDNAQYKKEQVKYRAISFENNKYKPSINNKHNIALNKIKTDLIGIDPFGSSNNKTSQNGILPVDETKKDEKMLLDYSDSSQSE